MMSGAEPLCAQERETISRELRLGNSARCIGQLLGRHHNTIAREIERSGGAANYRPALTMLHKQGDTNAKVATSP